MLLCAFLQVCLSDFPLLVSVCSFPFPAFASFALFYWASKALVYAPFVRPSTSRPSVSPALLCLVCVFCVLGMAEFPTRNDHPYPPKAHSRGPPCPQVPPTTLPPKNTHHAHPLPSPTHYYRHIMLLPFWHILPRVIYCACVHVLCVCVPVLGCSPSILVLTQTLSTYAHVLLPFLTINSVVRYDNFLF